MEIMTHHSHDHCSPHHKRQKLQQVTIHWLKLQCCKAADLTNSTTLIAH